MKAARLLMFAALSALLNAQQGGFIAGVVHDRSGGVVAAAEVRVQNEETGSRQALRTDSAGQYSSSELLPGSYKITVRRNGFRTAVEPSVTVAPANSVRVDVVVDVLPLQQEVTVSATKSDVDPTSSGLTMSRQAPTASLPENGRDVHALFSIMPGATVTPASISAGGQFTVSGQRPNANAFRVDGVSGNVGIGVVAVPGAFPGDALPGMSTIGGMQNLASKEDTESVELRSANFDAQFGERPGAQISIETRAGSNELHGALFGYMRPQALNSQDWFARGAGVDLPSAFLAGWGGGAGGPIWRKRTFFFAALEQTDLRDRALQVLAVPSLAARADPLLQAYRALFDAFPLPVGRALNPYEALGYSPLQKNGKVANRSIRIDQILTSKLQGFARYTDVPSSASSFELGTANSTFAWKSATMGLNRSAGRITQEWRANFTESESRSAHGSQDTSTLNAVSQAVSAGFAGYWQTLQVSMAGVGRTTAGGSGDGSQNQWAFNYSFLLHGGKNDFRFGGSYSRLRTGQNVNAGAFNNPLNPDGSPVFSAVPSYGVSSLVSPNISALLAGAPLGLTSSFGASPSFVNQVYAGFAEDTLHVNERLSVMLGLRWDAAPTDALGTFQPAVFTVGSWNGTGSIPVPSAVPSYYAASSLANRWKYIAPRVGLAYRLGSRTVFRAGAGLFNDTGLNSLISNTNPLSIWQYLPPPGSTTASLGTAKGPELLELSLPQVWEWKTSIDKSIGEGSLLSLSYLGSSGSKLLRNEASVDPQSAILNWMQFTTRGRSSYNALLANMHASITPSLFLLASYTWSHSIDTGSSDTAPILSDGPSNKGTSSFDVRQVFSASLGYRAPSRWGRVAGSWTLSSTFSARSGFPFNVTTVDESIGLGFDNADRANVAAGQPIWLTNSGSPGGRTFNPAAFATTAGGMNGTLGRNVLTGAGFFQVDTNLRRQFRLYRGGSVEAVVSAFNLLNHASFANPVSYLGSALFGQSTSMTNLMLGSGSPTTGLTPLFQAGGPRTIEIGLRFSF